MLITRTLLILIILLSQYAHSEEILLYFTGDCTFDKHFNKAVGNDLEYPFKNLQWLKDADVTMVNCEGAVSLKGKKVPKQFNFRINPKYIQCFINGGVDILNCANNHSFDYGGSALLDMIDLLDSAGLKHIGIGKDLHNAVKPLIMEIQSSKIAFLSYNNITGGRDAGKNVSGTAPIVIENIIDTIKALKSSGRADYIIINFHWGTERDLYPDNNQRDIAHKCIDAGANAIIGHHPHVLQGIEEYNNGIIAYSLGNFIFGGNSRKMHNTIVLAIRISSGKLLYQPIPVKIENWQGIKLEGEEKDNVLKNIIDLSNFK